MRRTLCCLVLVGLAASAPAEEAAPPRQGVDEIVVPGRAPGNLRLEIERLEVAVYDRFNALNSNDEFDIHCLEQAQTGSNIPLRTCAPNFVIRAESRAAKKMLTDGRSSDANNYSRAEHNLLMEQKGRELTEEMQRVARQDEQLLRDLARLAALKQVEPSEPESPAER